MPRSYKPIDPGQLRTYPVERRQHKSAAARAAELPPPGATAAEVLQSLPDYLGARAFRKVIESIVAAVHHDRPVVAAFGAHVIKVGCGPILIDLIQRGILRAIVANGACAIHDVELALFGETSEEVAETIRDGRFGMVRETMEFFDGVARHIHEHGGGLGAAVGHELALRNPPHPDSSVFLAAHHAGLPACVHIALGTDTVHVSPGADGAALGQGSMFDFRLACDIVSDLGGMSAAPVGGVWLNIGSAVILPEVFLKAVSVARNLGANLDCMTTANFDMIRHYRPHQNVVTRPVQPGRGHDLVGHHEIMLPLLRQAVIDRLSAGTHG